MPPSLNTDLKVLAHWEAMRGSNNRHPLNVISLTALENASVV
jgi:hypothetical protein